MRRTLSLSAVTGIGLTALVAAAATTVPAAAAGSTQRSTLAGSLAPASERSARTGSVAAATRVDFDLVLNLSNAAGAAAEAKAVSDPGSASYRHYLSDSQWTAAFAPTQASVATAAAWLRSQGFSVDSVPADRLFIAAHGTAAQVSQAFGATLGMYRVSGTELRLADGSLSVPASLSGTVTGVAGVNQTMAVPANAPEPPPPAGFANPQPCSAYWGEKIDTTDHASLYAPFSHPLPYDICGYLPGQLRSAYGISAGSKNNGSGVTLAIVDAYDSPTILADAQKYFSLNDPSHPLATSQFIDMRPSATDDFSQCAASGWFAEQALDVESSHSIAPGATIEYVGAQDCFDNNLLAAVNTAISTASVVSDSWGDTLGDIFTDAATRQAFDNTFLMADGTGVSVLFSSGDFGDNFQISGLTAGDYPATSPYITAVGGTSLEVNASGNRKAEYGWSTGKEVLCGPVAVTNCGSATKPIGSLAFQAGGGGGTSYQYSEPYYQAPVVPVPLAARNAAVTGILNRVEPDISLDADAQTGMLIGLTQTFTAGSPLVRYGQFKEGGTSLASPLLAGVIADTDQVAGVPVGFLNPTLYKAYTTESGAFHDIVQQPYPHQTATIRVDYAVPSNVTGPYIISVRQLTYEGLEEYCDQTGSCIIRDDALSVAPGFDSMTGLGSISDAFINDIAKF